MNNFTDKITLLHFNPSYMQYLDNRNMLKNASTHTWYSY